MPATMPNSASTTSSSSADARNLREKMKEVIEVPFIVALQMLITK